MKTIGIFIITAFISLGTAFGQSHREELDLAQSFYGKEKKDVVEMVVSGEANLEFWVLYDRYEEARKELGQNRLYLVDRYTTVMNLHDQKEINRVIKDATKQRKELDKLIYKYYKKIKRQSGTEIAARFYQMEHYFLGEIRSATNFVLPVVASIRQ